MAYNGSGTFNLSDTLTANTDATAEEINAILSDLASGLTAALPKDGQSAMTGVLKLADGSASAPGAAFSSDPDTGWYRSAANILSAAAAGGKVADISATGINLPTGKEFQVNGVNIVAGVVPSGGIIMWSGAIADIPSGWYLCNGSNGTPDLRNRFVIAAHSDDAGVAKTTVTGSASLSGGSKDAINVSHTHTANVTDGGHTHTTSLEYTTTGGGGSSRSYYGRTGTLDITGGPDAISSSSATTGITVSNSTEGSSGTDANLPPYYALAYIMKA